MASLAAEVRRSRRTLERMGMTPEEELEQLIREQELDDTSFVRQDENLISMESPCGEYGKVQDLIGVDEDGELLLFLSRVTRSPFEGEKSQHGTIYGYKRLLCRCLPCTIANTRHTAGYRARRRAEKKAGK